MGGTHYWDGSKYLQLILTSPHRRRIDTHLRRECDTRNAGSLAREQLWTALDLLGLDLASEPSQAYLTSLPEEVTLIHFAEVVRTLKGVDRDAPPAAPPPAVADAPTKQGQSLDSQLTDGGR